MPRKPLTDIDIENFRKSYCEQAYALYQQEDYDAVTIRGIAKAMGCSPMMAYRYFENKEAVFALLRATLFHRLADALEAVPLTLPPLEYLTALVVAYAGFAHDEPHAYRLLYMIHVHQAQDYPETELAQKRTRKILFDATRKAIDVGDLQGDATLIAHSIWACVHGLVSLELANQLTQGAGFDQLFPVMLENILKRHNPRNLA
ncbi:TetR/AcrR family transcriptional regulator [Zhongshania sp.]|uniref:TetR/AcrR family transcriptional regulator n=1 Tax=Zhongshania sp. TaxID=1971902 RepID=UPI003568841E